MKTFKENQNVFYILWCYEKDNLIACPHVFCYEWHENLKECFNENLLFATKEEAYKKANELGNSIRYKV